MRGVFPLVNSEGIALDVLVHGLWVRGCVPDWLDFMRAAKAFGWNLETTCSRVLQAVSDVHGRPWHDAVEQRLHEWLATQIK
ncbi:MAG: hypothetical protein ACPG4T_05165 [Nannocystaceae bacterium]